MMTTMSKTGAAPEKDNRQLLEEILNQLRISNVKLYGNSDADDESEKLGRLPKVELSSRRAHVRIDKIEKKIIYVTGIATALGVTLGPWIQAVVTRKLK